VQRAQASQQALGRSRGADVAHIPRWRRTPGCSRPGHLEVEAHVGGVPHTQALPARAVVRRSGTPAIRRLSGAPQPDRVSPVSDTKEHSSLILDGLGADPQVGDADFRGGTVADLRDIGRGRAVGERSVWAVRVPRRSLHEALRRGSRTGDSAAQSLADALESGALDSDDLIIARWPETQKQQYRDRINDLAESLMPDSIPQPVELLQARRNAVMRRDMLAHYGYYSAEELADLHGSTAKNRYALAARWSREGRVFGVPLGARTVFPAFQFDADARPYPLVAEVLAALPREDMSPWGVALWWYGNNAWLPGEARPAELIGTQDQGLVLNAAQRLAEPLPL
jgi:hypothetical protein